MLKIEKLFPLIETNHIFSPCKDASQIDRVEKQYGFKLPDDLKIFYRRYNQVELFRHEFGATYRLVTTEEIRPTWKDILGEDSDELGPENWLTICDVLDGNYVALEVFPFVVKASNLIDCFHETFATPGQSRVIAKSFTEFLESAIYGESNMPYFVKEGFSSYGDAFDRIH